MRTFLNDYCMEKNSKIDMRMGNGFIVPRNFDLPEDFQLYISQYPTKISENNLKRKLGETYCINHNNIIIGAGSNGIIQNLVKIFFKNKGELIVSEFSFEQPEFAVTSLGGTIKKIKNNLDFSISCERILLSISNETKAIF